MSHHDIHRQINNLLPVWVAGTAYVVILGMRWVAPGDDNHHIYIGIGPSLASGVGTVEDDLLDFAREAVISPPFL